jgi:hypothetical protein
MSSNRHWNVARHIERLHKGIGVPFNQDDSLLDVYKNLAEREGTLSPAFLAALQAASISSNRKYEEHTDIIDKSLPYLRKLVEFRNLSREILPSSQGIPLIPGAFGISCAPTFSQSFTVNDDELEIVGYLGHTCENCLINHPLALYVRKLKNGVEPPGDSQRELLQKVPTVHGCDPQRLIDLRSLPIETRKDMIADLHKTLPERVMTSVKSWTKNRSGLVSFEMKPYDFYKNFSLDLFPDDENHWSIRIVKNRKTIFNNDEEMMDFIRSANSSTAGLFNINSQSQENGYKSVYFTAIVPMDIPSHGPTHSFVV